MTRKHERIYIHTSTLGVAPAVLLLPLLLLLLDCNVATLIL